MRVILFIGIASVLFAVPMWMARPWWNTVDKTIRKRTYLSITVGVLVAVGLFILENT